MLLVFPFYFQIIKVAIKDYSSSGLLTKQENDFHWGRVFSLALNDVATQLDPVAFETAGDGILITFPYCLQSLHLPVSFSFCWALPFCSFQK